ncbi:hypothetical protein HELRODRAFT_183785 [Helobdella robusta]|uniref:Uncharacterized protein n=1 Tax=Helobdella robusta TaxID=6412 RepID=T1FK68_HELRO|nr:hypothetical protein HELRODRAFT_183785 [Helobdella robusta]ESO10318.1 hypothetical protein HELRODRAFT_183785 [Helobdella robusta]
MSNEHHMPLTRTILDSNTTILDSVSNTGRLKIREALYINKCKPTLNQQYNSFDHTLQLFSQYRELIPTIAVENKPADVSVPKRYEYRSNSNHNNNHNNNKTGNNNAKEPIWKRTHIPSFEIIERISLGEIET